MACYCANRLYLCDQHRKLASGPSLGLGGTCHRACFDLCDQHKKLVSGYPLDRIMPRCKLFIGFIMICANNTENWRVAMCEASLAIYSSFGLRPLGALCYELCDQHRKLACPRYILDLDGNGLIGFVVMWATNTESWQRVTLNFTVRTSLQMCGGSVISLSVSRLGDQL